MKLRLWAMRGSIASPGPRRPDHAALAHRMVRRMAAIDGLARGVDVPMAG